MKLKMTVEKKDLVTFAIFSLILFIIVAIGVGNLNSLISTQELIGFNPFPGIFSKLFISTFGITIVILVVTYINVEKTFINREKGIGFKIEGKKSDGYNKWEDENNIKKELNRVLIKDNTSKYAGVPLILNKEDMFVDNSSYHTLVIGTTGSGKTECIILPTVKSLAKKGESMIITDPKGEIYEKTGKLLKSRGYNIVILNFRDTTKGNKWNPLTLPYELYKSGNHDKAIELIDDLASNIIKDKKSDDPFWENSASDYFAGLVESLFKYGKEDEINLNSISFMDTVGNEKGSNGRLMNEFLDIQDSTSSSYQNLSGTVTTATETQGGIVAIFKQKLKIFTTKKSLSEMLSVSDFDMGDIGRKPTAVFLIVHDEKKTYHSLATIFIKQCYEKLIDVAQNSEGNTLPNRVNLLLDEFANMPALKDISAMVTAARSRRIKMLFIIQNFAQLDAVYGEQEANTIKGNCGNLIYLLTTELKALEEISKMCGEKKSKKDDKTASTPLVTISDLQKLKIFDAIIIRHRMAPFKTHLTPDFSLDWGFPRDLAQYPQNSINSYNLFDLRKFLKEYKLKNQDPDDGEINYSSSSFGNDIFSDKTSEKNGVEIMDLMDKINKRLAEKKQEKQKLQAELDKELNILNHENNSKVSVVEFNEPKLDDIELEKKINDKFEEDDEYFDDFFDD